MGRPRAPEGGTLKKRLARAIGFAVTGGDTDDAGVKDADGNVVVDGYGIPVKYVDEIVARNEELLLREGRGRVAVLIAVWLIRSRWGRARPMKEADVERLMDQKGLAAFMSDPGMGAAAAPHLAELEEIQRLRKRRVARERWEEKLDELLRSLKLPRSRSTRERHQK